MIDHSSAIDRMKRLEPILPVGHDDIIIDDLAEQARNQRQIQERHITGGNKATIRVNTAKPVVYAADRTLMRDIVAYDSCQDFRQFLIRRGNNDNFAEQ